MRQSRLDESISDGKYGGSRGMGQSNFVHKEQAGQVPILRVPSPIEIVEERETIRTVHGMTTKHRDGQTGRVDEIDN